MILLPCINLIEKLVFRLIKDDPEDLEEQADFDLLEERFLAYPALAIGQSHTAVNGMAKKARKNINRALSLLGDYSQDKYNKVQEKENLIDKYEDTCIFFRKRQTDCNHRNKRKDHDDSIDRRNHEKLFQGCARGMEISEFRVLPSRLTMTDETGNRRRDQQFPAGNHS